MRSFWACEIITIWSRGYRYVGIKYVKYREEVQTPAPLKKYYTATLNSLNVSFKLVLRSVEALR